MKMHFTLVVAAALMASACNPQKSVEPAGITVVNMNPQQTKAGTPFNVQVDQGSGMSFELSRPAPAGDIRVLFDGKPLGGVASSGVIVTATVPTAYLMTPGVYPVTMQMPDSKTPVAAGFFTVE